MSKIQKVVLTAAIAVLFLAVVGGSFLAGYGYGHVTSLVSVDDIMDKDVASLDQAEEVWRYVVNWYVDDVSEEDLAKGAARGVIDALDDPYSKFMPKQDYEYLNEETHGSFYGVGIELGVKDDMLTIIAPIEDTPGYKAGLKSGDVIVKIDKKETVKLSVDEAIELIRGPKGEPVVLTISRTGAKTKDYKIIRDEIEIPNVESAMIGDNIGYIRVYMFNEVTTEKVKEKMAKLKGEGMDGLILDLRNNPGGLFEESIDLASLFIAKDKTVVSIVGRATQAEVFKASGGATDMPLVVLVNNGSASASEIFAGAIQDHERGKIVGETTFGKGVIQTIYDLEDGSGITLTTAKYSTPNGRTIHKKGIKPDVVVKFDHKKKYETDIQKDKAVEVLKSVMTGRND